MDYEKLIKRYSYLSDKLNPDLNPKELSRVRTQLYDFLKMNVPLIIEIAISKQAMIETTKKELDQWAKEFLEYYEEYIVSAHIDGDENLIVVARPEKNFDEVKVYLKDSILDTVSFEEHLDVHLYEYGTGNFVEIGIN